MKEREREKDRIKRDGGNTKGTIGEKMAGGVE